MSNLQTFSNDQNENIHCFLIRQRVGGCNEELYQTHIIIVLTTHKGSPVLQHWFLVLPSASQAEGVGGLWSAIFCFFSPEVTDPLLFNSHDKPFPHIGASPPPTQPTCLYFKYNLSLCYIRISFKNQKKLRHNGSFISSRQLY